MFLRSRKHSVFCTTCLLLLSLGAIDARAQGYDLRCRGMSGAFLIDGPAGSTYSIRFAASSRAAGVSNAGLDPGTCSWVDRPLNSAEPSEIRFDAQPWLTTLIATQLNDSRGYWSFTVVNSNKGYFKANGQSQSTAPPKSPDAVTNADVVTKRPNVGVITQPAQPTNTDIVTRRPVLNPPSAPPIDKQPGVSDQLKAVQLIRDVKIEDIQPRSFTVSFTTTEPAGTEVRVSLWAYGFFSDKKRWVRDDDVEYDGGHPAVTGDPADQISHRITIHLKRDMISGERRQLLIYALITGRDRFAYEHIFTVP